MSSTNPHSEAETQALTSPDARTAPGRGATTPQSATVGPGSALKGRYVVERELGRGGIGVVLLARDRDLHDKPVVLKMLLDRSEGDEYLRIKFQQEGEALAKIDHPGVVKVLQTGTLENGSPFIAMEYVEGGDLRGFIRPSGMDFPQAAHFIRQIGAALQAAHAKGIYHRDLKPENIMLQALSDGERHVKIIDFGVAKVTDSKIALETSAPVTVGTLVYMAPEQFEGKASAASDIFSFGVIAYEMITGRRPFNPETDNPLVAIHRIAEMQRTGVIAPPRTLRPGLSDEAQEAILSALAYDATKRPTGAREFGERLALALSPGAAPGEYVTRAGEAETLAAQPPQIMSPPAARAGSGTKAYVASDPPSSILKKFGVWAGATGLIVALGAGGFFLKDRFGSPASPSPVAPEVAAPRARLACSLTVRRMRNRRPDGAPFAVYAGTVLESGSQVRVKVECQENGFVYLVNESPQKRPDGLPQYVVLFPSPTSNGGESRVSAGRTIQMPDVPDSEKAWFQLDEQVGVETIWILWSQKPIAEIEAVKTRVNPKERGEITAPSEISALRTALEAAARKKYETAEDEANKTLILKTSADAFAYRLKIEHR
jgi:serine/threonine-protein kinase